MPMQARQVIVPLIAVVIGLFSLRDMQSTTDVPKSGKNVPAPKMSVRNEPPTLRFMFW